MVFLNWTLVVIIISLLYILKKWKGQGHLKLPPGPSKIPLIGNIHQLAVAPNPYQKLSQWAYQFGPLYTLQLATKNAIVISGSKQMKEIFSQFASTGKFKMDSFLEVTKGLHGILNTEGKKWQEQRNFAVKSLKEFGFGKRSLEPLIINEAVDVADWVRKESDHGKKGVQIWNILQLATVNTLWTIIAGERFSLDNTEMANLLEEVVKNIMNTAKTGLMFFPWLKYVAPKLSGYQVHKEVTDKLHQFVEARFEDHQKTREDGISRDYIDCYLEQMDTAKDPSSSFHGQEGKLNSRAAIAEILMAGSETTSSSITWLMFYMCRYPDIQKKVWKEIDSVIGANREPSLQDRESMPFLEAVILESFRYSSFSPLGVIHEALEDISCDGFVIPKGYILIANLYHVHHSTNTWGDPENFRPERFLEVGGDKAAMERLRDNVVPFQKGKRSCLGEGLAMDIIFLFVSKLLQNFEVLPETDVPLNHYLEPEVTYTLQPKRVKVILKPRM